MSFKSEISKIKLDFPDYILKNYSQNSIKILIEIALKENNYNFVNKAIKYLDAYKCFSLMEEFVFDRLDLEAARIIIPKIIKAEK